MLDNFLNDLEDLIHYKPLSGVDILPLVIKYTYDKPEDETINIRLRINSIIDQLKESKSIETENNFNFLLMAMRYGQFPDDPIFVRGTIKF